MPRGSCDSVKGKQDRSIEVKIINIKCTYLSVCRSHRRLCCDHNLSLSIPYAYTALSLFRFQHSGHHPSIWSLTLLQKQQNEEQVALLRIPADGRKQRLLAVPSNHDKLFPSCHHRILRHDLHMRQSRQLTLLGILNVYLSDATVTSYESWNPSCHLIFAGLKRFCC